MTRTPKRAAGFWAIVAAFISASVFVLLTSSANGQITKPKSQFKDCIDCPNLVRIAKFNGASPIIAVSVTPITFNEWQRCVAEGGCDGYTPDRQGWSPQAPVVNVSFDDAQRYIAWLKRKTGVNYRLLREHEWAKVALGGAKTTFPWGDQIGRNRTNCLDCGSRWDGRSASPVRLFKPNGFGLYDIVGNVAHWTEPDPEKAHLNKSFCKEKGDYAAIMGASWAEPSKYLGVNEWACFPKVLRDDTIGFRVVREMP